MADSNGVQSNSLDYAYHNPLPGTTPGANATGVVDPSVIVAGGSAPGAHPFVDMVGGNGMRSETSMALENPAFTSAEELARATAGVVDGNTVEDIDAQEGGQLTAAQDAALPPTDADNPAANENAGDLGDAAGDNRNAQPPLAPGITSLVAGGTAGHATPTWTAPDDPDGYGITGYEIVATSSDGGATKTYEVGNILTVDLSGLTSAKHYTVKVAAKNVEGTGAQSAASASVLIA